MQDITDFETKNHFEVIGDFFSIIKYVTNFRTYLVQCLELSTLFKYFYIFIP